MERVPEGLTVLQQEMGITFRDLEVLRQALTHASYLNENPEFTGPDNERLEFLGDAICDFLTAEYLYQRFPGWAEGQLTALRAQLVCSEMLFQEGVIYSRLDIHGNNYTHYRKMVKTKLRYC